jgi:hypothetical protein
LNPESLKSRKTPKNCCSSIVKHCIFIIESKKIKIPISQYGAMAPVTLRRLSNGQMVLEINADGDYTARLFDLTGSRIGSRTQSGRGSWRIGTESVSSGSYILKVNSNGTEIRRRVMVYR